MPPIPEHIAWYLSGFSDGEGSFNISLRKKTDYRVGWQPVLSFNVSQREKTVLVLMKHYFNCGIIKRRKDGLYSFDVTNPQAITGIIIPFFKRHYFLSKEKQKNFLIFCKITNLMAEKHHLQKNGFRKLLNLRERLNVGKGRKRKYTIQDINLESSETIRQPIRLAKARSERTLQDKRELVLSETKCSRRMI